MPKTASGRRFWIADLHLGHALVAGLRGFEDSSPRMSYIEHHDETILKQLRSLNENDEVWVLGDISSGRPEGEEGALDRLAEIPAKLHLIAGNHDSVSSIHRNGYKHQRRWLNVFESVQQFGRIRLNGFDVLMSHYPYKESGDGPERGEGRYSQYRLPDEGLPLIHGHTHQSDPHMQTQKLVNAEDGFHLMQHTDLQQFCVSWDAHRRLVTEHDLNKWLQNFKDQNREAGEPMNEPIKHRKKPVEIEAMQWFSNPGAWEAIAPVRWVESQGARYRIDPADGALFIVTLEGEMRVRDGDYIIKGVRGEFYPCEQSIFEETYEVA